MNEIIKDVIDKAEKLRYECIGASVALCNVWITPDNNVYINKEGHLIYHSIIDDLNVHSDIFYITGPKDIDIGYSSELSDDKNGRRFADINEKITIQQSCEIARYINSNPILQYEEDLDSNPTFETVRELKSGDGLIFFTSINHQTGIQYKIPYYQGLFKTKKSDKFSLYIYDLNNLYMVVRIINKKPKLEPIDIYLKILKT